MVSYAPGSYPKTRVLSAADRHLVNRFSYGITPKLADDVRQAGSARAWFDKQLKSTAAASEQVADWWPNQHYSHTKVWDRQKADVEGSWEVMADYQRRLMARRIGSPHQVRETMTEFFENHLHITVTGDAQAFWRVPYGSVIRKHALGRFDDMLVEAIQHPAMQIFLTNAGSTKEHPNENLGRELLELHTVGVGNHSEADVKNAAKLLTGFRIDYWMTFDAWYSTSNHYRGRVEVLNWSHPNQKADGRPALRSLLRHLAQHRKTAEHLSRKLVLWFCREDLDATGEKLVQHLADVYVANKSAIAPVLKALVASAYFKKSVDKKLRDPGQDIAATYRLSRASLAKPTADNSAANALLWQTSSLGLLPLAWPRPDGAPIDTRIWANPARAMASANTHLNVIAGWYPTVDIDRPKPAAWVPRKPIIFRDLVDHVSRIILHRPSTEALLRACCLATDKAPGFRITENLQEWEWTDWDMARLLAAVMEDPRFYVH
ncbi:hypothetical protein BH09ACT11_BH09ACT11_12270 [soil metagenome]